MKLSLFDYNLPKELIAQKPAKPRDSSRLMLLNKNNETIQHRHFYDLPKFLKKGDVLVLNNTKVFPARLIGRKAATGGRIEIFLLKSLQATSYPPASPAKRGGRGKLQANAWQCLVGGKSRRVGLEIIFNKNLKAKLIEQKEDNIWLVEFNKKGKVFDDIVNKIGETPVPPYVKSNVKGQMSNVKKEYQTIYAKYKGSVAAPTAGLHFTPRLLKQIKKMGVQIEYITLHVGLGTFASVKTENIEEHKMHPEWATISAKTAKVLLRAKQENRRIIAVGTTTVRALEALAERIMNYELRITNHALNLKSEILNLKSFSGYINIFIYPGYKFKFVDAMITNFHTPKSTLLMLVSAFYSRPKILRAYKEAVKKKYRFYSFGDAMLIM